MRTPSLRRHRASGQAVVTLNGRDLYLGPWPASCRKPPAAVQQAYDRLIAEWLASGRQQQTEADGGLSVAELILRFWKHAEQHYRHDDGTPTSEIANYRMSLRPLRELYGTLPANEFSPLKLKALRQKMIDADLSRCLINHRIGRIVRMLKWGVSEELVHESVYRALTIVRGLERGRTKARESDPVLSVAAAVVEATLPFLPPPIRAMVQLQQLTGARPGEVCVLRGCDIDMSGDVWLYRPRHHKTAHHGKERVIRPFRK